MTPIKPLYKQERPGGGSGVARLSLGDLSLSFSLSSSPSVAAPSHPTRFSLRHVTEIHRENYVTNALGYISRKRRFRCADETGDSRDRNFGVSFACSERFNSDSLLIFRSIRKSYPWKLWRRDVIKDFNLHDLCTNDEYECELNGR